MINLTINGNVYPYPEEDDEDWGEDATNWAQAVTLGMLQKSGGLFQLLADLDFGTSYGVKSLYFSTRASAASSSGVVRLAVNELIGWRNNADDNDILLGIDGSDRLTFDSQIVPVSGSITNADINAAAAIALSKLAALNNNIVPVTNGSGILTSSSVTSTELGYISGVTSSVQTQLDGKADLPVDLSADVTGVLPIANGGTGEATAQAAIDALVPATTKGSIFAADGTNVIAFPAGNDGEILSYDSSEPSGLKAISALVNPMNAEHDMIVGGTAGAATRLGLGTASYVLGNFGSALAYGQITDASVDAAAAIAYSKLDLAGSIVDADIDNAAAIAYSKLDLAGSIVDADIDNAAAIAYSKLDLAGSIVDADIDAAAAIAYSKLDLTGSIVNADIDAAAAIAYSKLALSGSIVDADINNSAAIAWTKISKTGSNLTDIATRSHTSLTDIGTNTHPDIDNHIADTNNPHSVTATQVGLGNVDNTSDATKNSAVATLQNKTLDAPIVDNTALFNEESTPMTPSAGVVKLYPKSDGNFYKLASDGVETRVGGGSGSGSRNYLADWYDGVKSVGSVTSGITATGNITPSAAWKASNATGLLTIANVTSGGLREGYSLKLDSVAAGAAFVQMPEFVLDTVDLGKPVTVMFDHGVVTNPDDYQVYMVRYDSSGVYQESIPIFGTASAASPNSAQIPAGSVGTFQGFFIARDTATDLYALRYARNSASDTTDVLIDTFYVGPQSVVQGAAITDWVSRVITASNSRVATNWVMGATTTAPTFGTNAAPYMWQRQEGDSLHVRMQFKQSGSGTAGTGNYLFKLPSELTIDLTKTKSNTTTDNSEEKVGSFLASDGTIRYGGTIHVYDDGSLAFRATTAANASTFAGPSTLAASGSINFGSSTLTIWADFLIPIVGWSSNVTMANRAVEEYAFNTDTSGSDDTTSFGYGIAGALVPNRSVGTAVSKRVRFTTPILPTDDLVLLAIEPGGPLPVVWERRLGGRIQQGTPTYGVALDIVNTTDVDVAFGSGGYSASNATYGGNGSAFSALYSAGWRWVVKKVSGGASVGYPVSARNVVGDTSGTAVPSGFIGEVKTVSFSYSYSSGNGWRADSINSMVLTKGVWLLFVSLYVPPANSVNHMRAAISTNSDSNSSGIISDSVYINRYASTTLANGVQGASLPKLYVATADTTVYGKFFLEDAEVVDLAGGMCAVRIA